MPRIFFYIRASYPFSHSRKFPWLVFVCVIQVSHSCIGHRDESVQGGGRRDSPFGFCLIFLAFALVLKSHDTVRIHTDYQSINLWRQLGGGGGRGVAQPGRRRIDSVWAGIIGIGFIGCAATRKILIMNWLASIRLACQGGVAGKGRGRSLVGQIIVFLRVWGIWTYQR